MFTASNPVAYGMTLFFNQWKKSFRLDQEHVDQFYTHLLLREVSAETANRQIFAPHMQSIPWVARWCKQEDPAGESRPVMSRQRYREALRHLWLRGVDGMQIFNSVEPGFEQMSVYEIVDAVSVYDEMLGLSEVLTGGEPLNLAIPKMQDAGILWSGVRKGESAVVRTFKQGGGTGVVTVEAWPGKQKKLRASSSGETYLLNLKGGEVTVRPSGP
jgi:hypothetical protein